MAQPEKRENSVLFSLRELRGIEESRVQEEENAAKEAEQARVRARLDAERRVKEEEAAKVRAAEEAARFYCSVFKNSKMGRISYYPDAGEAIHGKPANSVMTVEFELEGMPFLGLNGGPHFTFDEAVSFQVPCKTQDEIDYYWKALTADGGQEGPCGWLKDKFGLSWQVFPDIMPDILAGPAASEDPSLEC